LKILIGTPCGGGVVTTQYLMSIIETTYAIKKNNPDIHVTLYTLAQESLLPRGRNHIAQVALTQKYDKLFFIDADGGWSYQDFMRVAMSPFPLVAGIVPLKIYPTTLNYLPFKEDEKYFGNAKRTFEGTMKLRKGHGGAAEIPVAFVGTAFLCIDQQILMKLSETCQSYKYPNPHSGQLETHWDFFNASPVKNEYYSEDWGFCHKAREAGYDVRINTDVFITHTGNHTYRVEQ